MQSIGGLRRWFRRILNPESQHRIKAHELALEAASAPPGQDGSLLNQAGDASIVEGDAEQALQYWRKAIQAFLAAERVHAARAVGKKVARSEPGALDIGWVLAWTAIAVGEIDATIRHLELHLATTMRGPDRDFAVDQLTRMAEFSDSRELREWIGEILLEEGEDQRSNRIFGMALSAEQWFQSRDEQLKAICEAARKPPV